ncbi:hypothetical protein ACIRVF_29885 [Kitasatospora sp. NPDC101157]|uniref:hypothetical protein n=1 Tax=Kitasatospora sp. NPDC101157 TaxID=3364098 RepID=UPI00380AA2D1
MRAGLLIFITLFLLLVDFTFVRAAWLSWHHPARAPRMTFARSSDPSVRRGHERGVVPFAGGFLLLTVMMFDVFIANSWTGTPKVVAAVIVAVSMVGFMLGLLLHLTVVWFNWPRFLVPPSLRGDVGVFVERARHRRELAAALREATGRGTERS